MVRKRERELMARQIEKQLRKRQGDTGRKKVEDEIDGETDRKTPFTSSLL